MKTKIYISLILALICFNSCERTNCHNKVKDGDETGVDCGGSCLDCPPTVTTLPVSQITTTSANVSLKYYGILNENFYMAGICYSTTQNPTYSSGKISTSIFNSDGYWIEQLKTLTPNTTYYIKGFAIDDKAIVYGNEVSFTTAPMILTLPTIVTTAATEITQKAAVSGGNITSDGGATITARGICFNTTGNPTTANSLVPGGSGSGSFISNLTGLSAATTYYVRAYATNSVGTAYGNQVGFTTNSPLTIGQSYGGGIIAYIDSTGLHGLIAAPTDQSAGVIWYNGTSKIIGSTSKSIGTGNANTNNIISAQGAGTYAATICQSLVLGGYSDWYLPSKDELGQLYLNRVSIGSFVGNWYWSSTEAASTTAWVQHFGNASQSPGVKSQLWGVRAVRSF